MTHPHIATQGIDGVVIEDAPVIVQVEARGERPVEEPGLRKADGTLLSLGAAAQTEEHLPASAEEVVLGEVEGAESAVLRAVAAADREEARGLLRHLDVDDDLVLGGPRYGLGLDLLEIVEVLELLLGALQLLRGEEIAFGHGDLAPENLLLAPRVPADVDPLDEHFGTFRDFEGDVDLAVRYIESDLGVHVG